MEFLANNWYIIIACAAGAAVLVYLIIKFFKLPRSSQIEKVKEWLLFAVTLAEREFGSGTGQLKLRYVYDMFVTKFPYLVQFVSFEFFSDLVDNVLVKFKDMFNTNNAVKQYVVASETQHNEEI